MRVLVDKEKCIAACACSVACPEVFAHDEEGIVVLLDETPKEELRSKVEDAIAACPAFAIELRDD
jgi:ferredoxin